ncbi:hypothetical protein Tco_0916144 [Tanacetum coccineum]
MMDELKFFIGLQVHKSPRGHSYRLDEISEYNRRSHVSHRKLTRYCFCHLCMGSLSGMTYSQTPQRDADHVGCHDDCKSTSGGLQFLGEKLVSWSSKKQDCTALSTAEAEYVSLSTYYAQVTGCEHSFWTMDTNSTEYRCIMIQRGLLLSVAIRFSIRVLSTLTSDPETPIPTAVEIDVTNLHETIQMNIATQRSLDDFEAQQNVAKVNEHLEDEELDHLLEGNENANVGEFMNDIFNSQEDPDTRIELKSDKESLEVEIDADLVPVKSNEEEEESAKEMLIRRKHKKGKSIEDTRSSPPPTPIRSPRTHIAHLSTNKETLQELTVAGPTPSSSTPSSFSTKPKTRRFKQCMINRIAKSTIPIYVAEGLLLERKKTQSNVAAMIDEAIQKERENLRDELISQVNDAIANHIPPLVDSFLRDYMSNNVLHVYPTQTTKANAQDLQYQLYLIIRDDEQLCNADLAIWLSLKIKFEKITTVTACRPFTTRSRDHNGYQDDDACPERESSAKRQKNISGTQEQLDKFDAWMENVGTDDEVPKDKESKKERLTLPTSKKKALVLHSCQRDLKASPLTLIIQDPFYLKHGNLGPKKYTLSLHKFPTVLFPDDDMEEQTSRQKQLRDNPHEVYLESKIVETIRTTYELGHEHKFITEIIVKRANGNIDPTTEPDYKYLNKNDIEDMYLLCINDKLSMESYLQKVNLTAPTITFPAIEEYKVFDITYKPVCGIIYDNKKKENKVMVHKEIYKFCDATLKRALEKLEKYN